MRGSRYRRLDTFAWGPGLSWSLAVAAFTFVIAALAGLLITVEDTVPGAVAERHHILAWLILAALSVAVGGVSLGLQHVIHDRFSITNVSAGPAVVVLSHRDSYYFDEYLHEIVYFFQRSKVDVVIFEDLDRFNDPHIFETLRELNTVLNNAEQLPRRPIQFIYAIRDSVFEQLDDLTDRHDGRESGEGEGDPAAPVTSEQAAARSRWHVPPASNRTKFFDLVIPMVPFITRRTARDLLRLEFEGVEPRPSDQAIDLVAAHLTDMRLIKNIRNEYVIFARSLLPPNGLDGLKPDQLFAMTVYKNVHMEDYEHIRDGTSTIDQVFAAARTIVDEYARITDERIAAARHALSLSQDAVPRARSFGERLNRAATTFIAPANPALLQYHFGGRSYTLEQASEPGFWRDLAAAGQLQIIVGSPGQSSRRATLTADQLADVLDIVLHPGVWTQESAAAAQTKLDDASVLRDSIARADPEMLFGVANLTANMDGEGPESLSHFANRVLPSALASALVAEGYIDRNYILYTARYGDRAVSSSAMNFILQNVQADRSDFRYRFSSPTDVDQILHEEGDTFRRGGSIFNIEVFDHLLAKNPWALTDAFAKLGDLEDPRSRRFIAAYLSTGRELATFVRKLAGTCTAIFEFLGARETATTPDGVLLLNAALEGISNELVYTVDDSTRTLIESHCSELTALTALDAPVQIERMTAFLGAHSIQIPCLGDLTEPFRAAVVRRGMFPITLDNLQATTGQTAVPLDALRAHEDLYRHVLRHLTDYVRSIEGNGPTVDSPGAFVQVLNDAADALPLPVSADVLARIAADAADACVVEVLNDLTDAAWAPVVAAGRMRLSGKNAAAYVDAAGIDAGIRAALLHAQEFTEPLGEQNERMRLALRLLDDPDFSAEHRLQLVKSLELENYIEPTEFGDAAAELVPQLIADLLVEDGPAAWRRLRDSQWTTRERLIVASDKFSSYFLNSDPQAEDLQKILESDRVPDSVKRLTLDHFDELVDQMNTPTLEAVANLAARENFALTVNQATAMIAKGVPADATLTGLRPAIDHMDAPELITIVQALGPPYERLAETERKAIQLPMSALPILQRLRAIGLVTSFKKKDSYLQAFTHRNNGRAPDAS